MFSTLHLAALETLTQPQPTICWPNLVGSYLASNSLSISKILQPPGCASSRVLPHHLALRETAIEIPLKVPPYPPYSQHLNTPKKNTAVATKTQNTMARAFFHALLTLVSLHLHWATLLQMAIEKWPTFRPQWTSKITVLYGNVNQIQPGPCGHTSLANCTHLQTPSEDNNFERTTGVIRITQMQETNGSALAACSL